MKAVANIPSKRIIWSIITEHWNGKKYDIIIIHQLVETMDMVSNPKIRRFNVYWNLRPSIQIFTNSCFPNLIIVVIIIINILGQGGQALIPLRKTSLIDTKSTPWCKFGGISTK